MAKEVLAMSREAACPLYSQRQAGRWAHSTNFPRFTLGPESGFSNSQERAL